MAFKKLHAGKSNPTGDKAFNRITEHVFGKAKPKPQDGPVKNHSGPASSGATAGGPRYDTATNTFRKC